MSLNSETLFKEIEPLESITLEFYIKRLCFYANKKEYNISFHFPYKLLLFFYSDILIIRYDLIL